MSTDVGGSNEQQKDVVLCPQCQREFLDNRQLFRHVQQISTTGSPRCLDLLGMDLEEFKKESKRKTRQAWVMK